MFSLVLISWAVYNYGSAPPNNHAVATGGNQTVIGQFATREACKAAAEGSLQIQRQKNEKGEELRITFICVQMK